MLVFFGAMGLMGFYIWNMRMRCKVGRKCFSILPKKLIYNIKISKFLIQG
jgi:hypothetical protein